MILVYAITLDTEFNASERVASWVAGTVASEFSSPSRSCKPSSIGSLDMVQSW